MIKTKSGRIEIRINPRTKQIIEKAARLRGETISSYIIANSLSSARKDIQEIENITLNDTDRDMFFELISNPPEANNALKNLLNK